MGVAHSRRQGALVAGVRKERDQLQFCLIPGATQSAADIGKRGWKINLCFEGTYVMKFITGSRAKY